VLDHEQLAVCFDARRYLGHVDEIYRRVFED